MKSYKRITASILVAALLALSPLLASASDRGGSSSSSDHTSSSSERSDPAPAPAQRSDPAPVERTAPAPVERTAPAPVERTAPAPVEHSAPVAPPVPAPRGGTQPLPRPPQHGPVQPLPPYQARVPSRPSAPVNNNAQSAPNPSQDSSQWDWDYGTAWVGTESYWGNGFWGALATGLEASAYIVAPGSPGAQLLQAYGLTQTPCGPPNLVEILGPGASEICALPTDQLAPGVYHVDVQTLTLISSP